MSDELYNKISSKWKNARQIPEINDICNELEIEFKRIEGYRTEIDKEFTFKVWSVEEYEKNVKKN